MKIYKQLKIMKLISTRTQVKEQIMFMYVTVIVIGLISGINVIL